MSLQKIKEMQPKNLAIQVYKIELYKLSKTMFFFVCFFFVIDVRYLLQIDENFDYCKNENVKCIIYIYIYIYRDGVKICS